MFYVYVLKSLRNGKRYTGCTGKLPEERLKDHNSSTNQWTRQNGPFDMVYFESYEDKREALLREKFLKSGQGRKWLQENGR